MGRHAAQRTRSAGASSRPERGGPAGVSAAALLERERGGAAGTRAQSRRAASAKTRRRRRVGWIPFLLIVLSISLVSLAGVQWVRSPSWGQQYVIGKTFNSGIVPNKPTTKALPRTIQPLSPNRIVIPALNAQAPIVPVGDANRELEVPENPLVAGWWQGGVKPGARRGTAIIAGHINYAGVQGALGRIGDLKPGNTVYIYGIRAGSKKVRLTLKVAAIRTYEKASLPYAEIFNQDSPGRVAIVTCGGPFDSSTGNYLDNIVVYAVPV